MRVLVQRSGKASVSVDEKVIGSIPEGLVILVGFTEGDNLEKIEYLAKKVVNLRIFPDENGVMNKSILDFGGSILSISQFTLYADTKKGNRPSYLMALGGDKAIELYNHEAVCKCCVILFPAPSQVIIDPLNDRKKEIGIRSLLCS